MSALSQVTVVYVSTLPSTTSTVTIPIPASLQNLDSLANQNASGQTGFAAFDSMVANIVRGRGVRFVSGGIPTFIPLNQIVSITGQ